MVNLEIFALYDNGFSHFIGQMSRISPWKQSIFQQQCYTWDSKSDNDTSRNHNVIEAERKKIDRLCILLKTSVFLATLCLNGLGIFALLFKLALLYWLFVNSIISRENVRTPSLSHSTPAQMILFHLKLILSVSIDFSANILMWMQALHLIIYHSVWMTLLRHCLSG